jgi:hypothetical protein
MNTVAKEILNQLGGNKFIAMTGSKNFLYSSADPTYLSMHLTKNAIGAKFLKIQLTPMDTYTMTFSTTKKMMCPIIGIKTDTFIIIKEIEGVYCDMLQEMFTQVTGLYTSLGTMGR